ncbi:MAG TPA: flagellar biosynthesis protein FlhA [Oligoflexia bacterium]|nr:flagellar biosynthesis protein FlhA [Oligoflexia bacterium]HMP27486.1 flagellar biosynthesis protein FlhA [Oligoflexia bacterium]
MIKSNLPNGNRLNRSDIALAILMLAITVMLVIPLSPIALDYLLVLNLGFSLVLFIVGLYFANPLSILSFPSLLLLITLYRLSLNVASSRLILTEGHAGNVIQAFGTFLIKGEIIVGLLLFIIITIVNFIVVAKGAARVSEVVARFALDALPGKQMAIDADLRSGVINPQQAQNLREDLRKESQFYGAMDGASRFIQGDVIAGLFIIAINIVGGLAIGLLGGMSFQEAVHTYTTLTVGDGLVHQIPALLISIVCGIVVTRVGSTSYSSLGSDLTRQLFNNPAVLFLSGACLLFLGLTPGLPFAPFFVVGALLVYFGSRILRLQSDKSHSSHETSKKTDHENTHPLLLPIGATGEQSLIDISAPANHQLRIFLDAKTLYKIYISNKNELARAFQTLSSEVADKLGFQLALPRVESGPDLGVGGYQIAIGSSRIFRGEVPLDGVFVLVNPQQAFALGLDIIKTEIDPVSGLRVFWAPQNTATNAILEAGGFLYYDPVGYIARHLLSIIFQTPEAFLTLTDVHQLLKNFDKRHPGIASDLLSKSFLNLPNFSKLCQLLVSERIGIADLHQIIELVAVYCSNNDIRANSTQEIDFFDLLQFIREKKRGAVLNFLKDQTSSLRIFTLSEKLSEIFADSVYDGNNFIIDGSAEEMNSAKQGIVSLLSGISKNGLLPVAVVCQAQQRASLSYFLKSLDKIALRVISHSELPAEIELRSLGEI